MGIKSVLKKTGKGLAIGLGALTVAGGLVGGTYYFTHMKKEPVVTKKKDTGICYHIDRIVEAHDTSGKLVDTFDNGITDLVVQTKEGDLLFFGRELDKNFYTLEKDQRKPREYLIDTEYVKMVKERAKARGVILDDKKPY